MLAIVTLSVFLRGLKALNLDLFTQTQATFGETGGGIANAFVGSLVLVGIGAAIALPSGCWPRSTSASSPTTGSPT